jgi:predicted HTH domain antitoxin
MPEYNCVCCNFKTLIKTKYVEHCETSKHKRNIEKPTEISLSEQVALLENKVVSLELANEQQATKLGEFEQQLKDMKLKMDIFSMLIVQSVQPIVQPVQPVVQPIQPIVQPAVQPKAIGGQANDTGSESEKEPERYNEKWLNDNYDTKIDEFRNQIEFDEDEVADLFKNPHNFNKLVLKTLQDTVDITPIKHRGLITTSASRKNMWVLKVSKWEIDTEATFYIKNKLRGNVYAILDKLATNDKESEIYGELLFNYKPKMEKWEDIDDKIMRMFKS